MKTKIASLILLLTLFSGSVYAENKFVLNSLQDAIFISEKTKQPILLVFGSENCSFCSQLKYDIDNDKELFAAIDNYIVCYVDIDKNKELKDKYEVKPIPDCRIIKNKLQINKIIGYSKKTFLEKIKNVK
jgi:thioredoxin-related protein